MDSRGDSIWVAHAARNTTRQRHMALDTTPLERPGNSLQDVLRSKCSFARSLNAIGS
jgi:hypothetical protein